MASQHVPDSLLEAAKQEVNTLKSQLAEAEKRVEWLKKQRSSAPPNGAYAFAIAEGESIATASAIAVFSESMGWEGRLGYVLSPKKQSVAAIVEALKGHGTAFDGKSDPSTIVRVSLRRYAKKHGWKSAKKGREAYWWLPSPITSKPGGHT